MATIKNLSVAFLGMVLISLGTTVGVQAATLYGEAQPLGNGSVRSFVTLDDISGQPSDIGVALTPGALSSLPTDGQDITTNLSLPPSEASGTPFDHIEAVYRAPGHPGTPSIFDVPRFDMTFSLLNSHEQASICPHPDTSQYPPQCVGDELAQASKTPEPGTLPAGLQSTGNVEAGHGERYFDPDAPLPPVTSFYEYGFADSKLSFMDIVATVDYLKMQPNLTYPLKLPTTYSESGYYPTSYSVTYDATNQEYRVAYSGLTYRSIPEPSTKWGLLGLGALGAVYRVKNKRQKQKLAS